MILTLAAGVASVARKVMRMGPVWRRWARESEGVAENFGDGETGISFIGVPFITRTRVERSQRG